VNAWILDDAYPRCFLKTPRLLHTGAEKELPGCGQGCGQGPSPTAHAKKAA
jgi:hypothetical protein